MLRKTNGVTGEVTIVPSPETQRVRSVEEVAKDQLEGIVMECTESLSPYQEKKVYWGIKSALLTQQADILEVLKEGVEKRRFKEPLGERAKVKNETLDDILTLLQETLGEGKEI